MDGLAVIDVNFKFLADVITSQTKNTPNEIVTIMTRFRKALSFSWLSQIPHSFRVPYLAAAIHVVLRFTEHSDPTVRVTSYSTLGGLLVAVAPFSPITFYHAFGQAIEKVEVSPKLSIGVINMFMYLTRFVSPVRISSYVEQIPVTCHFGTDISDFIKFLPQTVSLMQHLPIGLIQSILRSVIAGVGRKPSSAFVQTVVQLVNLNQEALLPVLIDFIQANSLDTAGVWLGPTLLKNRKFFDAIGDSGRELFLNFAIHEFTRKPLNLCQFEHGCRICALFLRYLKDSPGYAEVHRRVYSALRDDYPDVYTARMLCLPTPLESLENSGNCPDSFRGNRLTALANTFLDNVSTVNADRVAKLFTVYKHSENDLYCTFVDAFAQCIDELLVKCRCRDHIELLTFILNKQNKNWVHNETVAKMIDNISIDHCQQVFPEYQDLALSRLLEFALSSVERLFTTARASIARFANCSNIELIVSRIADSNWLDELVVTRRFSVLAQLASLFRFPSFSTFFVDLASELLPWKRKIKDQKRGRVYYFVSGRQTHKYLNIHMRREDISHIILNDIQGLTF
jgi:hypothetical protein